MVDQKTKPSIVMDKNGALRKATESQLPTYLLSILTAVTIFCAGFLWNLNATMTKLEQRDMETGRILDEVRIKINNMQLDVRDVRERLIKLETLNQKK